MAKHRGGPVEGRIKIRYSDSDRFFEAEIEGGDETLVRAVQQLGSTMTAGRARSKAIAGSVEESSVDEDPVELDGDDRIVESPKASPSRKSQPSYQNPKIVEGLDPGSGKVSLKSFMTQHQNPTRDSDRYLVIMAWLSDYQEVKATHIDHIWTCYRFMSWTTQKDVSAPLRSLKRQGCVGSPERGKYSINHVGLNRLTALKSGTDTGDAA